MSPVAAGLALFIDLTRAELAALAAEDAEALGRSATAKEALLGELANSVPATDDPDVPALLAEARALTDSLALRLRLLAEREARRRAAVVVRGVA